MSPKFSFWLNVSGVFFNFLALMLGSLPILAVTCMCVNAYYAYHLRHYA